jgi:hypothetical protein
MRTWVTRTCGTKQSQSSEEADSHEHPHQKTREHSDKQYDDIPQTLSKKRASQPKKKYPERL